MCQICGCGPSDKRIDGRGAGPLAHHQHDQAHDRNHPLHQNLHFGRDIAKVSVPGMNQTRLVQIEREILAKNDFHADGVRRKLAMRSILALNLIASPGAGKTTLLVETLRRLGSAFPTWVIEGDQETSNDAERIRATGTEAVQINTGKGCHLDADMIDQALSGLALEAGGVLFIENVGNLACPAGFDLGEAHKVVILSVTEGDDKPVKYPEAFAVADLLLISKADLAPHCDFDIAACIARARDINPDIEAIVLSARDGQGMADWLHWIGHARQHAAGEHHHHA
ncbi:MAG: hydrogenase nickel incorporation protein HypB [Pseudomonadota bacterium]